MRRIDYDTEQYQDYARGRALTEQQLQAWISAFGAARAASAGRAGRRLTVSLANGGMGRGTMWGEQTARKMPGEAGFTSIETARLDGDIVNTYTIASRG